MLDKDFSCRTNILEILRQVNEIGVDLVQLRENRSSDRDLFKHARIIKRICPKNTIFIINNRLDIVQLVNADGLHLGQSDLPLSQARKILGRGKLIGISCRNLAQAKQAQNEGADYVSIGPVFRTQVKPDLKPLNPKLIKRVSEKLRIPWFVIGGINSSNINKVLSYGAERVALCRAICSSRNIKKTVRELRNLINSNEK